MNNTVKSTFFLTMTALIWGMAFVAQKQGMAYVGPCLFQGIRTLLGAIALFLGLCVISRFRSLAFSRRIVSGGLLCGVFLATASIVQQIGLTVVTAGKTGFLTALYIVLIPIIGIFLKKKAHWNTWASVAIATAGLYFLCIKAGEGFSLQLWDGLVIISAFFFACHILCIDRVIEGMSANDVLKVCVVQFAFTGVVGLILAPFIDVYFVSDVFNMAKIQESALTILYCGLGSTAVGYTFQAIGQRYANPSAASIILSLESVFAVIGGFLLLHERMSGREIIGCAVMFAAVIIAQLPERKNRKGRIGEAPGGAPLPSTEKKDT